MIKAILFDVDGVLIDSFESNLTFLQKFFKANGYEPPTKKEYRPLFYRSLWDVIRAVTGLSDETKIRKLWISAGNFDRMTKHPTMVKGAAKTVKFLSKQYRLGIVTSRIRVYAYEPPLDSIKPYFKTSVSYEDTKNHKPHPEPLLLAVRRLKISPRHCVYIGDADIDAAAAKRAGMKFILFSKKRAAGAITCVSNFKDIPRAISNISD